MEEGRKFKISILRKTAFQFSTFSPGEILRSAFIGVTYFYFSKSFEPKFLHSF